MKDLLSLPAVVTAFCLAACGGNSQVASVTEVRINTDGRPLLQPLVAAPLPSGSAAHPNAPLATAPPPAVEATPDCTVKPPAAAASTQAQSKLKPRQLSASVHAIEYERGVCRVRYADGDDEDSLAAAPEICDANPCLQIGQVFRARMWLIEADIPCADASFCVNAGPTYRDSLVVELRPQ